MCFVWGILSDFLNLSIRRKGWISEFKVFGPPMSLDTVHFWTNGSRFTICLG